MGLFAWFNRWLERRLRATLARQDAELEALQAEHEVSGRKLIMTDAEYDKLKRNSETAGPEMVERFRKLARLAGRE
jgi:hypothetical protein